MKTGTKIFQYFCSHSQPGRVCGKKVPHYIRLLLPLLLLVSLYISLSLSLSLSLFHPLPTPLVHLRPRTLVVSHPFGRYLPDPVRLTILSMFSPCLSSVVGRGIPKPLSLRLTLHKKSGKKRGKKNCPTENNSGTHPVPPKIIKILEFRNFGIPFDIGITPPLTSRSQTHTPSRDGKGFTISGNLKSFQGPVLKCRVSRKHRTFCSNELTIHEIRNNASAFSEIFFLLVVK